MSASTANEIERRWLLTRVPEGVLKCPSEEIAQGYLAVTPEGVRLRVRRRGARCYLTVKAGHGISQAEVEIELDEARFAALWPYAKGQRIEKRRYYLPHGAFTIEVDVFSGALRGLMKAEVEFGSEEEAYAFEAPDWFGQEVTHDDRYRNHRLATEGLPVPLIPGL